MSDSVLAMMVRDLSQQQRKQKGGLQRHGHRTRRLPRGKRRLKITAAMLRKHLRHVTRRPGDPRVSMAAELFVVYIPRDSPESTADSGIEDPPPDDAEVVAIGNETEEGGEVDETGEEPGEATPLVGKGANPAPSTKSVTTADTANPAAQRPVPGPAALTEKSILKKPAVDPDAAAPAITAADGDDPASAAEEEGKEEEEGKGEEEDNSNSNARDAVSETENTDPDYFTLEDAMQSMLETLGVTRDVWTRSDDGTFWQVSFLVEKEESDMMLRRLTGFGIGTIPNTSISVFPASYHRMTPLESPEVEKKDIETTERKPGSKKNGPSSDFVKSIKARLTVTEVVEAIKSNTVLTFDFLLLIILASLIAAMGLVENSSVVLVASMLISPLMGPILGWVFGVVIRNKELWTVGVTNELIGLTTCVLIGFLFGLITAAVNVKGALWGSLDSWPTPEMQSRGLTRSLWVGILIALPSGAGVALSILGGNAGSLVGVAISASLLPPAVNAGMLWAYSLVTSIHPPPTVGGEPVLVTIPVNNSNESIVVVSSDPITNLSACPQLLNNNYQFAYSCSMPTESFILGVVSLFLTLLNICCIFFMGIAVLKLKEVAPHTAANPANEAFWKKDIKIAREAYHTLKGKERMDLQKLAREFVNDYKKNETPKESAYNWTIHGTEAQRMKVTWNTMLDSVADDEEYQDVVRRLPSGGRKPFLRQASSNGVRFIKEISQESNPSIYFTPDGSIGLGSMDELHTVQTSPNRISDTEPGQYFNHLDQDELYAKVAKMRDPNSRRVAHFELPNTKPKKQRKVRGVRRMNSLPSMVIAMPSKTKTTLGRFKITTIPEEAEAKDNISRKSSVASLRAMNQTVKLENTPGDYNV